MSRNLLNRRRFLRGAGVAVTLPLLDSLCHGQASSSDAAPPKRMVCICTSLGLHAPYFFPETAGADYKPSPYLTHIDNFRKKFTVISGLSHPDQSGADGHSSERTWLTSARHPGLGGFRNTISIDQLVAERFGFQTRYPSLVLGTDNTSQSYTRSGVMIPAESSPSRLFARLFIDSKPEEVARQMQGLRDGRSILDTVADEARRISRSVGRGDREKLDEYFGSIRDMEQRLVLSEEWARRPKPQVDAEQPKDIEDERDLIARMQLLFDLVPLALQTDSTRVITILVQGRNDVPPVPGVSVDHHNLSHHGKDVDKIEQLKLIEEAQMRAFASLLGGLNSRDEADAKLLDNTMVLWGSNLGNANSHDTRNLPILVAGGQFRHGQHLVCDAENNTPLSNLFVTMLQQMGVETDSFGTSIRAGIAGLEVSG